MGILDQLITDVKRSYQLSALYQDYYVERGRRRDSEVEDKIHNLILIRELEGYIVEISPLLVHKDNEERFTGILYVFV